MILLNTQCIATDRRLKKVLPNCYALWLVRFLSRFPAFLWGSHRYKIQYTFTDHVCIHRQEIITYIMIVSMFQTVKDRLKILLLSTVTTWHMKIMKVTDLFLSGGKRTKMYRYRFCMFCSWLVFNVVILVLCCQICISGCRNYCSCVRPYYPCSRYARWAHSRHLKRMRKYAREHRERSRGRGVIDIYIGTRL